MKMIITGPILWIESKWIGENVKKKKTVSSGDKPVLPVQFQSLLKLVQHLNIFCTVLVYWYCVAYLWSVYCAAVPGTCELWCFVCEIYTL